MAFVCIAAAAVATQRPWQLALAHENGRENKKKDPQWTSVMGIQKVRAEVANAVNNQKALIAFSRPVHKKLFLRCLLRAVLTDPLIATSLRASFPLCQ